MTDKFTGSHLTQSIKKSARRFSFFRNAAQSVVSPQPIPRDVKSVLLCLCYGWFLVFPPGLALMLILFTLGYEPESVQNRSTYDMLFLCIVAPPIETLLMFPTYKVTSLIVNSFARGAPKRLQYFWVHGIAWGLMHGITNNPVNGLASTWAFFVLTGYFSRARLNSKWFAFGFVTILHMLLNASTVGLYVVLTS